MVLGYFVLNVIIINPRKICLLTWGIENAPGKESTLPIILYQIFFFFFNLVFRQEGEFWIELEELWNTA